MPSLYSIDMSKIKNSFIIGMKLQLFIYLSKKLMHVKPYSNTILINNNNNSGNSCQRKSTIYDKKHVSKTNVQCSCNTDQKSVSNDETLAIKIASDNPKTERVNCKGKDRVSVAIVGGGCATACTTILLKQNPAVKDIRLIDTDNSLTGPVCDIRQIDTSTVVKHYKRNYILDGLHNANIVALMDETHFSIGEKGPFSQFVSSCNYVKSVAECMMNVCPNAIVAVFTHPVTATLPLVSEIYKQSGQWDPNKIIGSAALETMRISAITANFLDLNPAFLSVPIAGGVDPLTVVPLLSRTRPFNNFSAVRRVSI